MTITISLTTLMALDSAPAHLAGYGAITADLAIAIATAARTLNLAIIDPATGTARHASAWHSYRPSQAHRDIVTTIAETCRFLSCRQPAWRCDLDHHEPYDHHHPDRGGQTATDNLDPLCRRHHRMKHHCGWSPRHHHDGSITWYSPTGHKYLDHPREITLPGELHDQAPSTRSNIGLADQEHAQACSSSVSGHEKLPVGGHETAR